MWKFTAHYIKSLLFTNLQVDHQCLEETIAEMAWGESGVTGAPIDDTAAINICI